MQIDRVETYPMLYRLPKAYGDANGYKRYRTSYLIRLITSSGIDGWGEIIDWLPTLDRGFQDRITPYLLGKQATDRLNLVDVISKWHQRSAAGVSMALTEIIAKHAGLSVCDLWGGKLHQQIPVYASFQSYWEQEDWMERSIRLVSEQISAGHKQIKVKIGGRAIAEDQKHIDQLMKAIPSDVLVAVDANQSYDLSHARFWERIFTRYPNWMWLEEPMPLDRTQEYEKLRSAIEVPIAGGENLVRCAQFLPLYQSGALDIAQPDLLHTDGIDAYRTHLQVARQFGYRVSPHSFDGSLARLYTLFAQACLPAWSKMDTDPIEPIEWDAMENPFTQLFPLQPVNGKVSIPDGVGIGIEPDWELINAMRWDGSVYV